MNYKSFRIVHMLVKSTLACVLMTLPGCLSFVEQNMPNKHFPADLKVPVEGGIGSTVLTRAGSLQALHLLSQKEYEKASVVIRRALLIDPQNSYLHFINGFIYHQWGIALAPEKLDQAQVGYEVALRLDPGNLLAIEQQGLLLLDVQNYELAQNIFAQGVLAHPIKVEFLEGLAMASYLAQDVHMAFRSFVELERVLLKKAGFAVPWTESQSSGNGTSSESSSGDISSGQQVSARFGDIPPKILVDVLAANAQKGVFSPQVLQIGALIYASANFPVHANLYLTALKNHPEGQGLYGRTEIRVKEWSEFFTYTSQEDLTNAAKLPVVDSLPIADPLAYGNVTGVEAQSNAGETAAGTGSTPLTGPSGLGQTGDGQGSSADSGARGGSSSEPSGGSGNNGGGGSSKGSSNNSNNNNSSSDNSSNNSNNNNSNNNSSSNNNSNNNSNSSNNNSNNNSNSNNDNSNNNSNNNSNSNNNNWNSGSNSVTSTDGPQSAAAVGITTPRMITVDVQLIQSKSTPTSNAGNNLFTVLQSFQLQTQRQYNNTTSPKGTNTFTFNLSNSSGTSGTGINYSLDILETSDTKTEILASPSLLTTDGATSTFFVGTSVVVGLSSLQGTGGSLSDKQVGVNLSVTPQFLPDGRIVLNVLAKDSYIDPGELPGNLGGSNNYPALMTQDSFLNATAVLAPGESMVLSGLTLRRTDDSKSGVPGLKDLPLIGLLAGTATRQDTVFSLYFIITPRVAERMVKDTEGNWIPLPSATAKRQARRYIFNLRNTYQDRYGTVPSMQYLNGLMAPIFSRNFKPSDMPLSLFSRSREAEVVLEGVEGYV